jgi:hypothetical protein
MIEPRKSMKMYFSVVPEGEVILRIENFRDDTPRKHPWQIWKPKYGKKRIFALTEQGVYDVTDEVERQLKENES